MPIEVLARPGEAPLQGRSGKVQRIIAAPRQPRHERADEAGVAQ
jgi:hypothetical protein